MLARARLLIAIFVLGSILPWRLAIAAELGEPAPFTPSYDDWGEYGLLQTPTARPGTDGDFAFTFSHIHPYDRYNIFFTPLPWMEAGFRYTAINNRPFAPGNPQSFKDKSFDLKLRLIPESASFPETSIGFRDIAGTGLFSSEYLVFNRRYYDFDFSGGLGWGYMSSQVTLPNPFGLLSHSFKVRPGATGAGAFGLDYFRGPNAALFGGVEYHTPIEGVRLKLELDPNNYQTEPLGNTFGDRSPVNFGVVYRPYSFLDLSAGFERGTTLTLRVTLNANFNEFGLFRDNSKPPALVPRPAPEPGVGLPLDQTTLPRIDLAEHQKPTAEKPAPVLDEPQLPVGTSMASTGVDDLYRGARNLGYSVVDVAIDGDTATLTVAPIPGRVVGTSDQLAQIGAESLGLAHAVITKVATAGAAGAANATGVKPPELEKQVASHIFDDLQKIGFVGESFAMTGQHAWLAVSQQKYHIVTIALGRAARIAAADLPPEVEVITVDLLEDNLTALSVTLYRSDLEKAVVDNGSPEEIWSHATLAGADPERPVGIVNGAAYPWYDWTLNPRLREQVGGTNAFFIYQVYAELAGTAHVLPGLSFDGSLGANINNNLNELQPNPASALPHVRSDIGFYLKDGKNGILDAKGDYLFNIAPNWYGRVSGGLLEYMYAGVDSEVLYRPYDQRLAVGLDINHVIKRGFDELFTLQSYRVTEGQLSFYYKLPFYNLTATLRVGRYLAGDKGATIELSREFAGGARAGIFATKTNVSAQEFGEGSFDKGFFLSFPLDLLLANPTRSEASYVFRPLTRDGGQYVDIGHPLYGETDGYDPEELTKMWPSLLH